MKGLKLSIYPAPYNTSYRSEPDAGLPTSSWWASGLSRAEFDEAVKQRREDMAKSRLGQAQQLVKDEA